jgi:hypothetical protein
MLLISDESRTKPRTIDLKAASAGARDALSRVIHTIPRDSQSWTPIVSGGEFSGCPQFCVSNDFGF